MSRASHIPGRSNALAAAPLPSDVDTAHFRLLDWNCRIRLPNKKPGTKLCGDERLRKDKSVSQLRYIPMQSAKPAALTVAVAILFAAFGQNQSARAENYLCRQQFAL